MPRRALAFWKEWVKPALIYGVVIFSFKSAIGEMNYVPSGSMRPTILEGDFVLVNKLAYDLKVPFTTWHLAEWGNPRSGDIVVCFSPKDGVRLVKRVIGVPGDVVELRDERLILNGEPVAYAPLTPEVTQDFSAGEKAAALFATESLGERNHAVMVLPGRPALRTFSPIRVPENSYFVMGDNRDNSGDSRYFGFVPRQQIVGKAKMVIGSFDSEHYWQPRLDRFFSKLR